MWIIITSIVFDDSVNESLHWKNLFSRGTVRYVVKLSSLYQ